jgi:OOP family OmpA-OmpF porin
MHKMLRFIVCTQALALGGLLPSLPAGAQPAAASAGPAGSVTAAGSVGSPEPSAQEMVEKLKTPPPDAAAAAAAAPAHTRGLRNLSVEATAPAAPPAPAARPQIALDIRFDFGSARVRPESQQLLDHLSQALQSPELAQARFAVEGHTDAKGTEDYNLRLSQSRADAVRDYLAQHGVAPGRLTPIGKGAADPANGADAFAAENRRVRIVNLE